VKVLHISDVGGSFGGAEIYIQRVSALLVDRGHGSIHWAPNMAAPSNGEEILALWNPRYAHQAAQAIEGFAPDVVHIHNFIHRLSPAVIAKVRALGRPIVMTVHDVNILCPRNTWIRVTASGESACDRVFPSAPCFGPCLRQAWWKNLVRYPRLGLAQMVVTKRVNHLLAPASFLADILSKKFPGVPCQYLPHMLPGHRIQGSRTLDRNRGRFLYVGRLWKPKGVDIAIHALKHFEADKRVVLEVAGEGPDLPRLQEEGRQLGLLHRIEFLGRISQQELAARMAHCCAVLVPSIVTETGPLIVLEALANSTPVLGTRLGGIRELVQDGETGYLFPAGDASSLAERMDTLMQMPGEAFQQMLDNVALSAEDFSSEKHIRSLMEVYLEVIERARESSTQKTAQRSRGPKR